MTAFRDIFVFNMFLICFEFDFIYDLCMLHAIVCFSYNTNRSYLTNFGVHNQCDIYYFMACNNAFSSQAESTQNLIFAPKHEHNDIKRYFILFASLL